jgi:Fic family protein
MFHAMQKESTQRVVENGFRQFDFCLEIIQEYLDPERPFALRPYIIQELQKRAVEGIEINPGQFRPGTIGIEKSEHQPPPSFTVEMHVRDLCDYINDNWHVKNAFHLSAYAMWRLNWIHPFTDGNGRTSRALSYTILCIKLGYVLPGSPTIPQQIEEDRSLYFNALEEADAAEKAGQIEVGRMEKMLRDMLARQLLSVIRAAGGDEILEI